MMNRGFWLVAVFALLPCTIWAEPPIWPMPDPFPTVPKGTAAPTYPIPRMDWPQRVAETNASVRPIASTIKLVFDGDSITDFWEGRKSKGSAIWNERYAKLNAFDFAISGDRTQHLLWRLSQGQVDNIKPTLVVLMIGTNNLGGGDSVEDTIEGIKAIVADYQKRCPDATILLQGVFPRGQSADDPLRAKVKAVNQEIAKLNDDKKVIYIDFGDKFLEPDGSMSPEVMPDFLHPAEKGYQIWADAIQPIIDKFFKSSLGT